MKETTRLVPVKAYHDDDWEPFCGPCPWNIWKSCRFQINPTSMGGIFVTHIKDRKPGPTYPVWYGDSKEVSKCVTTD